MKLHHLVIAAVATSLTGCAAPTDLQGSWFLTEGAAPDKPAIYVTLLNHGTTAVLVKALFLNSDDPRKKGYVWCENGTYHIKSDPSECPAKVLGPGRVWVVRVTDFVAIDAPRKSFDDECFIPIRLEVALGNEEREHATAIIPVTITGNPPDLTSSNWGGCSHLDTAMPRKPA